MRVDLQKFLQRKEPRDEKSFHKAHTTLSQVEVLPVTPEFFEHLKVFLCIYISRLQNWARF